MTGRDVAVAHEHFPEIGGGEKVALELSRAFEAPVYTGFVSDDIDPGDYDRPLVDLFGNGLIGNVIKREGVFSVMVRDFFYQFAWTHVPELYKYDVVVQSGNNPGWFVPAFDRQVVVKYTHSPPRTPFDLYEEYGGGLLTHLYTKMARQTYPQTATYPDLVVANSDVVARRIRRSLGVEDERIRVVYPPVGVEGFSRRDAKTRDYYFAWSRLRDAKNMVWMAEVFADLDQRLVIGGKGPNADVIRGIADEHDNVDYVGYMDDSELRRRASEARAVVFAAKNEDFGIVPIEAMAAGTPVLGVDEGFTKHQVTEGVNGYLFDREAHSLSRAVERMEADGVSLSDGDIEAYAQQFSAGRFREEMREVVEEAVERATVDVKAFLPGDG